MSQKTIFKTIYQYNKEPLSKADMDRLVEIARDCGHVKNYVYAKYSGVNGLSKIYPGYTVQNEILRFVMKQSQCFEGILTNREVILQGEWKEAYEKVSDKVDAYRLNQYLRRQVRRHQKHPHTEAADGFSVSPKGYRYDDHGIYISMKEKRQRLFIPLTDNNHYARQIYLRLFPEEGNLVIGVPLELKPKKRKTCRAEIGVAMGMHCMFVTDTGNRYGEEFLEYQSALANYIREKNLRRCKNMQNNPGKKKYTAAKARLEASLHAYINGEINRMLETEKPGILYIPKLPGTSKAGVSRKINASVTMWQKGYVKSRLVQKCRERSIELVEVFGKGISTECSGCMGQGEKEEGIFSCQECGLSLPERENTAKNVLRRGRENVHKETNHR